MRRGYGGLTTKEVATQSGLSNGALMHHFATKAELVVAATEWIYDVATERGQRVAESPEARANPIEGFIADCVSVYLDWPFTVALEVLMVARTDPELMERIMPVMMRYRQTTNARWLQVLQASGLAAKDAERVLNLTLNQVRGMAVHQLWQTDETYARVNLDDWRRLISEHVARKIRESAR